MSRPRDLGRFQHPTALKRSRFLGMPAAAGAALTLGSRSHAWAQDKTK